MRFPEYGVIVIRLVDAVPASSLMTYCLPAVSVAPFGKETVIPAEHPI